MIKSITMKLMPFTFDQVKDFFASYGFTADNIAPLLVLGVILYVAINKGLIKGIKKQVKKILDRTKNIESCIIELQTIMRNDLSKNIEQAIPRYGISTSPIVLKKQYRDFVTIPQLDKQIDDKKDELLTWLKSQEPKTGIDAQNYITGLVSSGNIEKYLDLTVYKQNLYQKGKVSRDASGILAVYLFEVLIPELDGLKDEKK